MALNDYLAALGYPEIGRIFHKKILIQNSRIAKK
jgi:hypothetical protein